jgi:hypothetical protein
MTCCFGSLYTIPGCVKPSDNDDDGDDGRESYKAGKQAAAVHGNKQTD